jgi:hypothetical protein
MRDLVSLAFLAGAATACPAGERSPAATPTAEVAMTTAEPAPATAAETKPRKRRQEVLALLQGLLDGGVEVTEAFPRVGALREELLVASADPDLQAKDRRGLSRALTLLAYW